MSVRLSRINRETRNVAVPIGPDTLNITYQPSLYTPASENVIQDLADRRRIGGSAAQLLATLILTWDLEDDEGQVFPPTQDNIQTLPVDFVADVVNALTADMAKLSSGDKEESSFD